MFESQRVNRREFLEKGMFFLAAAVGLGQLVTACGKTSSSYSSSNQPQTQAGGNCLVNGTSVAIHEAFGDCELRLNKKAALTPLG